MFENSPPGNKFVFVLDGRNGRFVTDSKTPSFSLTVPAGEYSVSGTIPNGPTCSGLPVDVRTNKVNSVTIVCNVA